MVRPSSIYEQLREQLRESLVDPGGVGDRLPSERKLAEDFGVSPVTVARALQELQNEGAIRRVPGKGTYILPGQKAAQGAQAPASPAPHGGGRPCGDAANLPWQTEFSDRGSAFATQSCAPHSLIVARLSSDPPSQSHQYWETRATSRLERCIQQSGGRTTVLDFSASSEAEIQGRWSQLVKDGINSVVLLGDYAESLNELWGSLLLQRQSQKGQTPFAVVQLLWSAGDWPFDTVSFSDACGARLATQHLWEQGHRKFAFFSPAPNLSWATRRYDSFRRVLLALGVSEAPVFFNETEATRGWKEKFEASADRLLDESPDCTAVVAANDMMAQALMKMAARRGRTGPKSLSVVGFDDWNMSVQMGLTTIHIPVEEMAEAATSLVIRRLNEPAAQSCIKLSINPSLIVRSSTAAP